MIGALARIIIRMLRGFIYDRFGLRVGRIISGSFFLIISLLLLLGAVANGLNNSDGIVFGIFGVILLIVSTWTLVRGLRTPKMRYDTAFPREAAPVPTNGYAYPPVQNVVSAQEPPTSY